MSSESVCVVGGGISGITAANALAAEGIEVYLVDRKPHPGGRSIEYGCKAVDTCVHCGVCLVRDEVRKLGAHPEVRQHYSSTVGDLVAENDGSFTIQLDTKPNPLNWQACVSCGKCLDVCPEDAIHHVKGWGYYIDESCNQCGKCREVCDFHAIEFGRKPQEETISASKVIVSTGFTPFDPALNRKWGRGANPRVITCTELERLFGDESYLPDASEKIAFIQCVGSRNVCEGQASCSRICCGFALRMANRIKQELPDTDIDMYYMDLQYFGKDFEAFIGGMDDRVRFIRSNPVSLATDDGGRPVVRFESMPGNSIEEKAYDLVVLAEGISPSADNANLADIFGLGVTAEGFLSSPASGVKNRVFALGTATGAMSIAECLEQASVVAAGVIDELRSVAVAKP